MTYVLNDSSNSVKEDYIKVHRSKSKYIHTGTKVYKSCYFT